MGNFDPYTTIADMTVEVDPHYGDVINADYYEQIQAHIDWLEAEIESAPDWFWEKWHVQYREDIERLKDLLP